MTADTALLKAERALLAMVQAGERLELSPRAPPAARTLRAEVLRGFFHEPPGTGSNWGSNGASVEVPVWISNAIIEGELDLSDLRRGGWGSLRALYLQDCEIPGRLKVRNTRIRRLSLRGCAIHHLDARGCQFEALLDLRGLRSAGVVAGAFGQPLCHVELAHCRIDGDLWAEGAVFCGPAQAAAPGASARQAPYALDLRGAEVRGSVRLDPRVRAYGGVTLAEARIGGDVRLRGARLIAAHGPAFCAENARIQGALVRRGWESVGGRWETLRDLRRTIEIENKATARRLARSPLRILLPLFKIYDLGFRYGFGYGVGSGRALRTLAICALIGVSGAAWANRHGLLTVGAGPSVFASGQIASRPGFAPEAGCGADAAPPLYALDLFLPAGELGPRGRCGIRPFAAADARRLERGRAEIETLWRRLPKPEAVALPQSAGIYAGAYAAAMFRAARIWLAMRIGDPRVWLWAKTVYSLLGWIVLALTLLTLSGIPRRNAGQGARAQPVVGRAGLERPRAL